MSCKGSSQANATSCRTRLRAQQHLGNWEHGNKFGRHDSPFQPTTRSWMPFSSSLTSALNSTATFFRHIVVVSFRDLIIVEFEYAVVSADRRVNIRRRRERSGGRGVEGQKAGSRNVNLCTYRDDHIVEFIESNGRHAGRGLRREGRC